MLVEMIIAEANYCNIISSRYTHESLALFRIQRSCCLFMARSSVRLSVDAVVLLALPSSQMVRSQACRELAQSAQRCAQCSNTAKQA